MLRSGSRARDCYRQTKSALTVPPAVQRLAGIKSGDRVEFKVSGGIINIIPEMPSAVLSDRAVNSLKDAPPNIRRAFESNCDSS